MSARQRSLSDTQAQPEHSEHHPDRGSRPFSYNRGPARHGMAPPPIPIDPAIDSWKSSTVALSPGLSLDHLLQSPLKLADRLTLSAQPSLENLSQDVQLPAMKQNPTDPDPLLRFWQDPGPWNSQHPRQSPGNPRFVSFDDSMRRNYPAITHNPRSPGSEVGSSATGRYHPDSGYGTQRLATPSTRSIDQLDHGQSGQSLPGDAHGFHTFSDDGYQEASVRSDPSPHTHYSPMDILGDHAQHSTVNFELACSYQNCGTISKNQSEYRKHMLRHEKPFKCDVPGCSKVDGFSTNNDLDRHKKSVHKIMPKNSTDRSFRCAASNCPKKEKIWPRLDNFRQHCIRIHQEEDCDELVRKSEMDPGHTKQASNLDDSSNHDAGDVRLGPEMSGISHFINPRITFESPLNTLSVPTYPFDVLETQDKHTSISCPINPDLPDIASSAAGYSPSLQQPDTSHLLQVPDMMNPRKRKRPLSPSPKPLPELETQSSFDASKNSSKKSTKSKPMASAKKAEEVSERLASEITKCINLYRDSPGAIQATIKSRLLHTFNPDLSRKRSAQLASLRAGIDGVKRRRITCDQCSATTARQCDMKKHKKRHTRPYGCTYRGCSKKFGSKNDWKRHENTQHYQIETWRCHEHSKTSATGQCASIFYRREQFQTHLREMHKKGEEYIREKCVTCRIGRNGQNSFWCGLCIRVVELEAKGLEAWEERFSHIDHHYKKGETIDEWVPLDGDLPQGRMVESEQRDDDDNQSEGSRSSEDDEDDRSQDSTSNGRSPKLHAKAAAHSNGSQLKSLSDSSRREMIWHCCHCKQYSVGYTCDKCVDCNHKRCTGCKHEYIRPRMS